jgi:tRNA threonylcarbamoyladenosine biosynthesis protein TsaB
MPLILHLETATTVCSVALAEQGKIIDFIEINDGYKHDETLVSFVQQILQKNNVKPSAIQAVAVSAGPGSYTGLRIGVSAAKGFCSALNIPLIAISTLQILAEAYKSAHPDFTGLLAPMLDARRMEVYTALFTSNLERLTPDEPLIVDENAFANELAQQEIAFFGNGAMKCQTLITNANASFTEGIEVSAQYMCTAAFKAYQNQYFEDLAYFEPFYLKPFQAGIKKV